MNDPDARARIYRALGVTDAEAAEFDRYLDSSGYTAARAAADRQDEAFRDRLRTVAAETSERLTNELGLRVEFDDRPVLRPAL